MSFRFKLEKVLHHRKSLEDIARKYFLEAQLEVLEIQKNINSFWEDIGRAKEERARLVKVGGTQSETLRQIYEYIKGTEIKIERQKKILHEKQAKVEELQLALQEAATQYKIIEKLKEKQHESYRMAAKKLEAKELDEMTTVRFNLGHRDEE